MSATEGNEGLVLVADDDRVALGIVARCLERAGLRVLTAHDGEEALRLAREHEPDLVVLDVAMPGLDGHAVCREIQAAGPTAPPVIFLTALDDSDALVTGLDEGAVDYVVKPFDAEELTARVRAALRTKRVVDELAQSAATDTLTGLPNRSQLEARLAEAVALARRYGRPLACLMVDIDHLKEINETFGRAAGDAVLHEVAWRLRSVVRASDVVGRYGGEEFLLLLPDTDAIGALTLAEKLRQIVAASPVPRETGGIPVRASVGVAQWEGTMSGSEALCAAADQAVRRAKELGRDRVVHASP